MLDAADAPSRKSIRRLISVGRSTSADKSPIWLVSRVDGSDDKAGIGERLSRIVMAGEIAAPAVRDDDKRQLVAR
jgi:hypothetical protein